MIDLKKLNEIIKQQFFCRMLYNVDIDVIYYADHDMRYEGCNRSLEHGWYHIAVGDENITIEVFEFKDGEKLKWYYDEFMCGQCLLSREEQRAAFLQSNNVKQDDKFYAYGIMKLTPNKIKELMLKKFDTPSDFFDRASKRLKKQNKI